MTCQRDVNARRPGVRHVTVPDQSAALQWIAPTLRHNLWPCVRVSTAGHTRGPAASFSRHRLSFRRVAVWRAAQKTPHVATEMGHSCAGKHATCHFPAICCHSSRSVILYIRDVFRRGEPAPPSKLSKRTHTIAY